MHLSASRIAASFAVALAFATVGVGIPAHATEQGMKTTSAASAVTTQSIVQFYRLGKSNRDHFHTTNWNEVLNATARDGYVYEGVGATVFSTQEPGTVPFYRLRHRNSIDHYHTTSETEVANAITNDNYVYEGIGAYVYPAGSGQGVPFYRLRHSRTTDHFHTTNWNEVVNAITNDGYLYEGVGANVVS
jgi:hypothetical protein